MPENLDIVDMIQWRNTGMRVNTFFQIFNLPSNVDPEIQEAISYLRNAVLSFDHHFEQISADEIVDKKEDYLKMLFADIFGEFAISIKLSAEGYMKYALRNLRSSLDLLFVGLYTVYSWPEGSLDSPAGTNPLAEAFFSGLWSKMEEIDIDQLVLSRLVFKVEDKEILVRKETIDLATSFLNQLYEKFGFQVPENSKTSKALQVLREGIEKAFSYLAKNNDNESWRDIQQDTLSPENFYNTLMLDERFCFRACDEHEGELLKREVKKLHLSGSFDEPAKNIKDYLTFVGPEYDQNKYFLTCDDCEKPARIFGLHSRPSTRGLVKLIKNQMPINILRKLNSCVSKVFSESEKNAKGYFGDIIYSKLYVMLNDYSHSNIVDAPTTEEWFLFFYLPALKTCQCVLEVLSMADPHISKTQTEENP